MSDPTESKIVQEYDNLYDTGIDHSPPGWVRYMSIEHEEDNMRELCSLMKRFESSNEAFDRLGHLFEFSVVEVVDTAFHLMKKFPNNPYLQAQCVCLFRYVLCDNDVYVPEENIKTYIDTIVEAIRIVNTCLSLDDDVCQNTEEVLTGFTENCIALLFKFGAKDKKDGVELDNLTKMYNKYVVECDNELDKIYKELF